MSFGANPLNSTTQYSLGDQANRTLILYAIDQFCKLTAEAKKSLTRSLLRLTIRQQGAEAAQRGAKVSEDKWYYLNNSQSVGPFAEDELRAMLSAKIISSTTLAWRQGEQAWRPLNDVFQFARAVPPPLPQGFANTGHENSRILQNSKPSSHSNTWVDVTPHPWRRYFARMLDILVGGAIVWTLIAILFYALDPIAADQFFTSIERPELRIVNGMATAIGAIVPNAICLGLSGGTIGKWLFGIRITSEDGQPIGLAKGFSRELMIIWRGLGLAIPIVVLFTLSSAYSTLKKSGATTWDSQLKLTVLHRPEGALQWALSLLGIITFFAVYVGLVALNQSA